jgi:hypothetical protein
MLLVSLEDVKAFVEKNDTSHDYLIGMIIEYVSSRVEAFLNRSLTKEYRTKVFDIVDKKRRYFLTSYPIDSSANITVTLDENVQTIDSDYYVWFDEGVVEFDFFPTYLEPKQLEITWLGGYDVVTTTIAGTVKNIIEDIPDAIKFAVLLQSAFVYRNRTNIGVTSVTLPNGSINGIYFGDLLPEVKSILHMYRKPAGD